jgi:LysM repeat protein
VEWPLLIGQKLLIDPGHVTPSPTPRPLTPIEKLTPESDGKYYHTVHSGETLSWIAGYYEVSLSELMAWNGLNGSSVIQPDQKLVLEVTPPATATPTPGPPTATGTATAAPPTLTPTVAASRTPITPIAMAAGQPPAGGRTPVTLFLVIGLAAGGVFLILFFSRKKQ